MKLLLVLFLSSLSAESIQLLTNLYNNDGWQFKDTSIDNIKISELYDSDYGDNYIKIVGTVDDKESILSKLISIDGKKLANGSSFN